MKSLRVLVLVLLTTAVSLGADHFFYRGRDSDVPVSSRIVRVLDFQARPVKGAVVIVTETGSVPVEIATDEMGMAAFPSCDVGRLLSIRCELRCRPGTPYSVSIAADPRAVAWPVLIRLDHYVLCVEEEREFERQTQARFDESIRMADRLVVSVMKFVYATETTPTHVIDVPLWEEDGAEARASLARSIRFQAPPPHWSVRDGVTRITSMSVGRLPDFVLSLMKGPKTLMTLSVYRNAIAVGQDGEFERVGVDEALLATYFGDMSARVKEHPANQSLEPTPHIGR